MKKENHFFDIIRKEGLYERYNDLFIPDLVGEGQTKVFEKNLQRLGLGDLVNQKSVLVFGKGCKDIKVNESFDVLFSHQNLADSVEVKATLKYVNVNPSYKIDYLPEGYSGICLIEFKNGVPDLMSQLKAYGEKVNQEVSTTLYLSEKPILNRLKELMKENQA